MHVRLWKVQTVGVVFRDWSLHLESLHYLGPDLDVLCGFPSDTLLVEMTDGWYSDAEAARVALRLGSSGHALVADKDEIAVSCCDLSKLVQLLKLKGAVRNAKRQLEEHREAVEKGIEQSRLCIEQKRVLSLASERNALLKSSLGQWQLDVKASREALSMDQQLLVFQSHALARGFLSILEGRQIVSDATTAMLTQRSELGTLLLLQYCHRRKLVERLHLIYSIDLVVSPATIANVPLPVDMLGSDEEQIATALGHVAHVVVMLSKYFGIPLRFRIKTMASRSSISDVDGSQTEFPLYLRGADRTRFDYAVFLLNKDIEQMLNAQGFTRVSLASTLPNLKLLLTGEGGETLHRVFAARVARWDEGGRRFPLFLILRGALMGHEHAQALVKAKWRG